MSDNLREEAEHENIARETCMCGDLMKDHWHGEHTPVSMYDYYWEAGDG